MRSEIPAETVLLSELEPFQYVGGDQFARYPQRVLALTDTDWRGHADDLIVQDLSYSYYSVGILQGDAAYLSARNELIATGELLLEVGVGTKTLRVIHMVK